MTVQGVLIKLMENLKVANKGKPTIHLGLGDPTAFPCFRSDTSSENAIVDALRSSEFNCYPPACGVPSARSCQLSPDDVFVTAGCTHAIEIVISVIARPGANILLPRPGYPIYDARASLSHLQVRHYDLRPEQDWEIDLEAVQSLADDNTVAIVVISPGNPCGNVFTYQHLKQVAKTAKKLGILVIADEVYHHLNFGSKPFVPMGEFGSIALVITVGSISKRWIVPGWRLGWIVTNDPHGILKKSGKPEGSMSVMVELNVSLLEDISDDVDFCLKLAKEESVIVLPGSFVGLKNWIRITFAVEPAYLEDGLKRIKAFYHRHAACHDAISTKNP
ncbi:hypothetical protein I3842_03G070200 [Carya illinoinensis]|uniref:Aminotransferase class I/classII large domain-containing protein n=1 Tax=Carya illinoinensis TaxID=32201 RepID=A0A922JTX9_CARIL|nr:hypothetical protein I3842_03G070200 [Carya illinoinensis]